MPIINHSMSHDHPTHLITYKSHFVQHTLCSFWFVAPMLEFGLCFWFMFMLIFLFWLYFCFIKKRKKLKICTCIHLNYPFLTILATLPCLPIDHSLCDYVFCQLIWISEIMKTTCTFSSCSSFQPLVCRIRQEG